MGTKRAKRKLLSREAKLRALGLLDMLYKPSELARELGIDQPLIYRQLIPVGLPYSKDDNGNIWLHGLEVAAWIASLRKKPGSMAEDDAYCLGCRAVVKMTGEKRYLETGKMKLLQATCAQCGRTVNRGVRT